MMGDLNQKPQQDAAHNQQDDEENHHQEEEETFTCEICIEPTNNKFRNSNKCAHPFCTDCMIKYIQMKLEHNISDIRCPATTCNHSLEPFSCRPTITTQLFEKWCDVLCESSVLSVQRVYCPNRGCSELILNECGDRKLKRCVCLDCKKPFCYRCKVPWHAGSTCGETRDENDMAFDVLYKKNKWRSCPRCMHCVERVDGCTLIRCRCRTMFCYTCGKERCPFGSNHAFVLISCVFVVVFFGGLVFQEFYKH